MYGLIPSRTRALAPPPPLARTQGWSFAPQEMVVAVERAADSARDTDLMMEKAPVPITAEPMERVSVPPTNSAWKAAVTNVTDMES